MNFKVWFKNRRAKYRKKQVGNANTQLSPATSPCNISLNDSALNNCSKLSQVFSSSASKSTQELVEDKLSAMNTDNNLKFNDLSTPLLLSTFFNAQLSRSAVDEHFISSILQANNQTSKLEVCTSELTPKNSMVNNECNSNDESIEKKSRESCIADNMDQLPIKMHFKKNKY